MNATIRPHADPKTEVTYLVVVRSQSGELMHDMIVNAGSHEIARDRAVERLTAKGHAIPIGTLFDTGRVDAHGLPTQRRQVMEMAVETVVTWRPPAKRRAGGAA